MNDHKRVSRSFTPELFDNEILNLNEASERGWQLTRRTHSYQEFSYDPDVRYRYALDYQQGDIPDPAYLPALEAKGWELVCHDAEGAALTGIFGNVSNWFFFRKKYDPALPESEYDIFDDSAALKEMTHRRGIFGPGRFFLAIGWVLLGLIRLCIEPSISRVFFLLCWVYVLIMLLVQLHWLRKACPNGPRRKPLSTAIYYPAMLCCALAVVFDFVKF